MKRKTSQLSKKNIFRAFFKRELSTGKIKTKIADQGKKSLLISVTTQYLATLNIKIESCNIAFQHVIKQT